MFLPTGFVPLGEFPFPDPAWLSYVAAAARVAGALTQNLLLETIGSSVIPLPHQIYALSRAMSGDRVRYLRADEVGLGKTVEAGFIMRGAQAAWIGQADRALQTRAGVWPGRPRICSCLPQHLTGASRTPFADSSRWWTKHVLPDSADISSERVQEIVIRTEKRRAMDSDGKPLFKPRRTRLRAISWTERHAAQRTEERIPRPALGTPELGRYRIMPLFLNEDGRTLGPTTRFVWDQTMAGQADVPRHIDDDMVQDAFSRTQEAARERGRSLYRELARTHREALAKERRRGEQAFEARKRKIERVGLSEVRNHRMARLRRRGKLLASRVRGTGRGRAGVWYR